MLKLCVSIKKKSLATATILCLIAIGTSLLTFSHSATAAQLTLAWEKVTHSNVAGYVLYYGESSGDYTNSVDVGNKIMHMGDKAAYTLDGLTPGKAYYFAAKSYDQNRSKYSAFSPELKAMVPYDDNASRTNENTASSHGTIPSDEASLKVSQTDPQHHNAESEQNLVIELGEIEIDHTWRRVTFNETFSDPIVIAKPLSYNETDPAIISIRDVDASGFNVRIQEWDYLDGNHALEKIGYLVIERGAYVLPDGTRLEADRQETETIETLTEIPFLQKYQKRPVVIASISTNNSGIPFASRLENINTNGFQVLFQTVESNTSRELNSSETFSYVAWEPSTGTTGGVAFEINRIPNAVSDYFSPIDYQQQFSESPIFLADMQTRNNEETASLRWRNKDLSRVEIMVDKGQPHNNETEESPESVGYALFGIDSP